MPSSGPFALFENNLDPDGTGLLLEGLRETVAAVAPAEVSAALTRVESLARNGAFVAVSFSYELGLALEPKLVRRLRDGLRPLFVAWAFEHAQRLDHAAVDQWLQSRIDALPDETRAAGIGDLQATIGFDDYAARIERIRRYIEAGDAYQVNLTFPMTGMVYGDPLALYARLRATQPARYGGIVRHAEGWILSRSPELFVERRGSRLTVKPMKGTAPRSSPPEVLTGSTKDRAENVMIVDLIRNDLGRLTPPGGVLVTSLFDLEPYPTVWQMTSTIEAEPVDGSLEDIVRALFPCGSVTGAPKIRAMEIIHELEPDGRDLYCGALGWIAPGGDFRWNVAIRTVTIDDEHRARLGIGSGVTHDSVAASEWDECRVKARFATLPPEFGLFETMLAEGGAVLWLDHHLARLANSARWFGIAHDPGVIAADIRAATALLASAPHRVRLTLDADGTHSLESAPLLPLPQHPTVVLSPERVLSRDPKSRHKTTARALYDRELARVIANGHFDALFLNDRGELTEGARSNVVLEIDGELFTPSLDAGALDGVMRRKLLDEGQTRERQLGVQDLERASRIFVCNALRGLVEVSLLAN